MRYATFGLAIALGVAGHMLWQRSLEDAEDRRLRREVSATFSRIADSCCESARKATDTARQCMSLTFGERVVERAPRLMDARVMHGHD